MAAISGGGAGFSLPIPTQQEGPQTKQEHQIKPDSLVHSDSEPSKVSTGEPVAGGPEGVANEDLKQAQIITSFAAQVMGQIDTKV